MKADSAEVAVVLATVRKSGPISPEDIADETLLSTVEVNEALGHLLRGKLIAQQGSKFRMPRSQRKKNTMEQQVETPAADNVEEVLGAADDPKVAKKAKPVKPKAAKKVAKPAPLKEPEATKPAAKKATKAKAPTKKAKPVVEDLPKAPAKKAKPARKPAKKTKAAEASDPAQETAHATPKVKAPRVSRVQIRKQRFEDAEDIGVLYCGIADDCIVCGHEAGMHKCCKSCKATANGYEEIEDVFGFRQMGVRLVDATKKGEYHVPQPWCRKCRGEQKKAGKPVKVAKKTTKRAKK